MFKSIHREAIRDEWHFNTALNRYNKYHLADLFCFLGDLTTLNPDNKDSLNKFRLSECFTPLLQFTRQWFRFAPQNKRPIFHYICISWMLAETATHDKQRHTNKWWDRRSPRRRDEIAEISHRIWSPRARSWSGSDSTDVCSVKPRTFCRVAVKRICY